MSRITTVETRYKRPPKRPCQRCPSRVAPVLLDGERVCWDCYNRAARNANGRKLDAKYPPSDWYR